MKRFNPKTLANANSGKGDLFEADFREEPYWWTAAPPEVIGSGEPFATDAKTEVAVVGGGITGLVAALALARAGAEVTVLDSDMIGAGAARRNAGFLGRTLKRSVDWLAKHHGPEYGIRAYRELDTALRAVETLVQREGLECHHTVCGRFIMANSEPHLRHLIADLEAERRQLGIEYRTIEKGEVRTELATELYCGGAVVPDLGSIHPGLYHAGLLRRARDAGVGFRDLTEVLGIEDDGRGKLLSTTRGLLRAQHVLVVTNGYTTRSLSWLARRVIPFRGFVIATELLDTALLARVMPHRRTYIDTRVSVDFIRPAPDSPRILFGGMTGTKSNTAAQLAAALRDRLVTILPDLRGVRLSRAWTGYCAGTFDFMPHIGTKDGVHFALGYNFAGIPLGTHFGEKLAARVLRRGDAESVFEVERFPTIPFYRGSPWFVPVAMRYFDWQDRRVAAS